MEFEAKVKVKKLNALRKKLISKGVHFKKKVQIDSYFKTEKNLKKKRVRAGDIILRIREEKERSLVGMKKLTNRAGVWVEHETVIENPREMEKILLEMGYKKIFTISKEREKGMIGEIEYCLDKVKELGNFLEIAFESDKQESKKKVIEALKELGFKEKEIIHKGYAVMISEKLFGTKFVGTG